MDKKRKRINVLIKPTDSCNLRCRYCYHADYDYDNNKMNIDIFEKIINMAIQQYDEIHFIWHGGEPLLMTVPFYNEVLAISDNYAEKIKVTHAMQTNGTLITENLMSVIKDRIKIGVSFDGIENDINRGSTEKTLNGIRILKDYQKSIGVIKVLTSCDYESLMKDYEFLNNQGINLKISPLFSCGNVNDVNEYVNLQDYIDILIKFMDMWINDINSRIVIEPFESMIKTYFGSKRRQCNMGSCLGNFLCVTPEGNVYPCSRYYPIEYMLGNVNDYDDLNSFFETSQYKNMVKNAIIRRNTCMQDCDIFGYCQGGCNNESISLGDGTERNAVACDRTKAIFAFLKQNVNSLDMIKNRALKERICQECQI